MNEQGRSEGSKGRNTSSKLFIFFNNHDVSKGLTNKNFTFYSKIFQISISSTPKSGSKIDVLGCFRM
jgi:hypothetical protein